MSRSAVGILVLALLAPITAEFLLGDQYLHGPPSVAQLGMLAVFVLLYGFGAIGIREIARRTGRGWPTVLLLGLAFGLAEEGLLTQSLFNPDYQHMHLSGTGWIPGVGISAPWATLVLVIHVVWSIGAPIAITERLVGTDPWLGRAGRWVTGVLLVLGALVAFGTNLMLSDGFVARPVQLVGTVVVCAALVAIAVRGPGPAPVRTGGSPLLGVLVGLVVSSGFQLSRNVVDLSAWGGTALMLGLVVVAVLLVRLLRPSPFGLGVGAVITYWWVGMAVAVGGGAAAIVEQSLLVAASAVLMVVAARRPWAPDGGEAAPSPRVGTRVTGTAR